MRPVLEPCRSRARHLLLTCVLALAAWLAHLPAATAAGKAVLIELNGVVGPAAADYIVGALAQADPATTELVILRLDTPGGLDGAMRAIVRAILIACIVACALVCGARELDPRALIGVSLAFSAAGLAPLMALTLWPRARSRDAMLALVVGLGTAETLLVYGEGTVRGLAAAAVVGCFASIIAGVLSSFVGGGDRSGGYRFVRAVWSGEGDVLAPDKGA